MKNEESGTDSDKALFQILTTFTENLKMSVDNGIANIIFEQEGLYQELIKGNTVVGKDTHEDVGPLRIYKAYVKENTTELVDPLDVKKKMEALEEKRNTLLTELDTQIKVSNATTFIEVA